MIERLSTAGLKTCGFLRFFDPIFGIPLTNPSFVGRMIATENFTFSGLRLMARSPFLRVATVVLILFRKGV
jgi:hypothetical protein